LLPWPLAASQSGTIASTAMSASSAARTALLLETPGLAGLLGLT
jgi:hypothetical protein